MVRMTGKRALMKVLRAEGVRYIFGNPGTSEAPIMDALEEYPDIEYMLTTQEGVAMGMADGYAIATGRPSFVNLHIETGLANGISLLHHAWEGNTPMVLTSGNKDVRKLAEGRTELTEMVRLFTKWSVEVTHPEQVPGVMRRAFNEARTPPTGPVYVGFSANALDDEADMDVQPLTRGYFRTAADAEAVEAAARVLAGASRPVMVVGDRLGQSRGAAEAVRLAELLGARVYASSYAEMNFPTGHPQFMGRVNPALPPGRATLSQGDVVLAVGANVFSGYFFVSGPALGRDTRLIHLDSAHAEVGKSEPTEIGIIADPRVGLGQLCDAVEGALSGSAREAAQGRASSIASEKAQTQASWDRGLRDRWDARPMTPERMMTELAKAMPPDAVISDDSITSRDAIHGAMEFSEPGSIHSERGGAIGWGMGSTLGIKLAHPDRPVVGILGDGSAMMTVQGLWTAANSNIPVIYVICNNRSYRVLKLNMDRYKTHILGEEDASSRYIAMDFPIPLDMAAIANAMGVQGRTIKDPEEIGPALTEALASGKPALLDVIIDGSV